MFGVYFKKVYIVLIHEPPQFAYPAFGSGTLMYSFYTTVGIFSCFGSVCVKQAVRIPVLDVFLQLYSVLKSKLRHFSPKFVKKKSEASHCRYLS
jgi:hypothetical protein